jgi:predicted Zn-dependent peptidase
MKLPRITPNALALTLALAALVTAGAEARVALAADPPASAPATPPASPPVLSLGVRERVLENGLTVLTIERPRAPRATCWVVVKTGSVNERPGITGISHVFEHLMFKGTKKIGVRDYALDQEIQRGLDAAWDALRAAEASGDAARIEAARKRFTELREREKANVRVDELTDIQLRNGATNANAFTDYDLTAYTVTLPSNHLELFFWLEADRFANAVFREFYSERDVVKEERRLDENRPDGPFEEELSALFWMAQPYHWPIIGWMSDIDAITPEDLRAYFDVFYAPNNCVVVVVGDVKAAEVERLAERYFAPIPRGRRPPPAVRTIEPRPAGERRLTVRRADARPRATLLFHVPAIGHVDGPALSVAQAILGGKSGRLYQALVEERELALEVAAHHDERRWAGAFRVDAYARSGVPPEALADAAQAVLDGLKSTTITADELDRARNRLEADLLRMLEDNEATTQLLCYGAGTGDWRLVERLPALWRAVTADDVRRVASTYLDGRRRTLGLMIEEEAAAEEGEGPAEHPTGPGGEKGEEAGREGE